MRVGYDRAMTWEMLRRRHHPRGAHALHRRDRKPRDDLRIAVIGAVTNHFADAMIEIDARREAQVDAYGAQLGSQDPASLPSEPAARLGIEVVRMADRPLWRQLGEPVAEPLHAAAFVVDRHE